MVYKAEVPRTKKDGTLCSPNTQQWANVSIVSNKIKGNRFGRVAWCHIVYPSNSYLTAQSSQLAGSRRHGIEFTDGQPTFLTFSCFIPSTPTS